jgi:hypothetical protein
MNISEAWNEEERTCQSDEEQCHKRIVKSIIRQYGNVIAIFNSIIEFGFEIPFIT